MEAGMEAGLHPRQPASGACYTPTPCCSQNPEANPSPGAPTQLELWVGDISIMVKVSSQLNVQALLLGVGLLPKCGVHLMDDLAPKPRATKNTTAVIWTFP